MSDKSSGPKSSGKIYGRNANVYLDESQSYKRVIYDSEQEEKEHLVDLKESCELWLSIEDEEKFNIENYKNLFKRIRRKFIKINNIKKGFKNTLEVFYHTTEENFNNGKIKYYEKLSDKDIIKSIRDHINKILENKNG